MLYYKEVKLNKRPLKGILLIILLGLVLVWVTSKETTHTGVPIEREVSALRKNLVAMTPTDALTALDTLRTTALKTSEQLNTTRVISQGTAGVMASTQPTSLLLYITPSATSPHALTVPQGAANVHIADFDFKLTGTTMPSTLVKFLIGATCVPSTLYDADLINVRYYVGGVLVAQDPDFWCDYLSASTLDAPVTLIPNQVTKVSIYADVKPSAVIGHIINKLTFRGGLDFEATYNGSYIYNSYAYTQYPITIGPGNVCKIDSFEAPESSKLNFQNRVKWYTTNCTSVVIESRIGQQRYRYAVPVDGTYTLPSNMSIVGDNTHDVVLIAANAISTASRLSTITMVDAGMNLPNQCMIFDLRVYPPSVDAITPGTTLQWTSPSGCSMMITAWRPNAAGTPTPLQILNGAATTFPNTGMSVQTPPKPTTFILTASLGPASWSRVVDISKY